jgi:hypothetical protein
MLQFAPMEEAVAVPAVTETLEPAPAIEPGAKVVALDQFRRK